MIPAVSPLHTGRLVLAPTDPLQAVDQATIARNLEAIGLIGAALPVTPAGELRFRIGPAFGSLIAFTGCAVSFGDADAADSHGPRIGLPPTTAAPRLFVGRNTRPPRCPACRAPLRDWLGPMRGASSTTEPIGSLEATARLRCPGCGTEACAFQWDFGRHGGAGRSVVLIEEVFPGEAAPLPGLLRALERSTGCAWGYFYQQD
jgi:hypothetical protein